MSGKLNLKENLRGGLGGGLKIDPSGKRDNPLEATLHRPMVAPGASAPVLTITEETSSPLVKQNMKLTLKQYEELTAFARRIQHNGQKHPERITINTVLRCLASLFDDFKGADLSGVKTEEDLRQLIRDNIRRKASN